MIWNAGIPSESGVTALDIIQSDAKVYDDIQLTIFGKKRIIKISEELSGIFAAYYYYNTTNGHQYNYL